MPSRTAPSLLRRLVVAPFWAGVLGGGMFLCAVGVLLVLDHDGVLPHEMREPSIRLAGVVATGVALFRGFDTPVRSYPALAGRLLGALGAGLAVVFAGAIFNGWIEDQRHRRRAGDGVSWLAPSARSSRRSRWPVSAGAASSRRCAPPPACAGGRRPSAVSWRSRPS